MAYRAHGLSGPMNEENVRPAIVTVAGVQYGPKRKVYPGEPSAELLAANNVNVQTLAGKPWPRSAGDRYCKTPPDKRPVNGPAPAAGPRSMEFAERDGLWPDAEEKRLQAYAEAKAKDPIKVGIALLKRQGVPEDKARAQVLRGNMESGVPDVADLIGASK